MKLIYLTGKKQLRDDWNHQLFVHNWKVCVILCMTEIAIMVKVAMIAIVLIMLHSIFDDIGIKNPILEEV
jgi:hypothetical protein